MSKQWLPALLFALAACGGDGSTSVSDTEIDGTWKGPVADNVTGGGQLTVTVAQTGATFVGTWSSAYANSSMNNSGQLSGTRNGSKVVATMIPGIAGSCPFEATMTMSSDTKMSGTYVAFNCIIPVSGTVSLTKQ